MKRIILILLFCAFPLMTQAGTQLQIRMQSDQGSIVKDAHVWTHSTRGREVDDYGECYEEGSEYIRVVRESRFSTSTGSTGGSRTTWVTVKVIYVNDQYGYSTIREVRRQFLDTTHDDGPLSRVFVFSDFAGHFGHDVSLANFLKRDGEFLTYTIVDPVERELRYAISMIHEKINRPAKKLPLDLKERLESLYQKGLLCLLANETLEEWSE